MPPDDLHEQAIVEITQAYFENSYPWILGYSGGKDSTATLQLVWETISRLPIEKRVKHVHVISSDTLVETPIIKKFLIENVEKINQAAKDQSMPISAELLSPIINDTFWVNLIGRGYPVPNQKFRWCTNRLKILTSSRFIESRIEQFGVVVVVLGVRKKESISRGQSIMKRERKDEIFSRNEQFESAFTFAPIREWESWDVWKYLMQNISPWGGDNNNLAKMYRDADNECPFVIDEKSSPCGQSRFGCWVCTLVERDTTLSSLIKAGENWLQPLLDYRDFLEEYNGSEKKNDRYIRDYRLKRGAVLFKRGNTTSEIIRGPYLFKVRRNMLERLFSTQIMIQRNGPDPSIKLITNEELHKIRNIWRIEGDWEDSVPLIYNRYYNDIDWNIDDANRFTEEDKLELIKLCKQHGIPEKLVLRLIDIESQTRGMSYRASIYKKMDKIFNEEWRNEDKLIEEQKKRLGLNNAN